MAGKVSRRKLCMVHLSDIEIFLASDKEAAPASDHNRIVLEQFVWMSCVLQEPNPKSTAIFVQEMDTEMDR